MAKLPRILQRIFAGAYTSAPSGQIAQFGSLAAGTPQFTSDPTVLQALSQFTSGWNAAVRGQNSPPLEDMNALFYLVTRQLAYLMQQGIPEWNDATEYFPGGYAVKDGTIYKCVAPVSSINEDPATNSNSWSTLSAVLATSPGMAKAFVKFDGAGAMVSSYNVSSVTKSGTGVFTVNLGPGVMPTANYCYTTSCRQLDTGGNAEIATCYPAGAQTTTAFEVRTIRCTDQAAVDVPETTIVFFHS